MAFDRNEAFIAKLTQGSVDMDPRQSEDFPDLLLLPSAAMEDFSACMRRLAIWPKMRRKSSRIPMLRGV